MFKDALEAVGLRWVMLMLVNSGLLTGVSRCFFVVLEAWLSIVKAACYWSTVQICMSKSNKGFFGGGYFVAFDPGDIVSHGQCRNPSGTRAPQLNLTQKNCADLLPLIVVIPFK